MDPVAHAPSPAATPGRHRVRASWRLAAPPLASALLLILAFPAVAFWPLAWGALVPFYLALLRPGARPAASGFWLGFALFLGGCYWMTELNGTTPADKLFPWVGLAAIQGGFFALFAGLTGRIVPRLPAWSRPLAFAAGWVLFEWVRSLGRLNFPWFVLAVSQVGGESWPGSNASACAAALTGQWGVSFAIALANGCLGEAWRAGGRTRPTLGWAMASVGVFATNLGVGIAMLLEASGTEKTLSVAALQGGRDLPPYEAHRPYLALTEAAAGQGARLIVWPEATVGPLAGGGAQRLLIEAAARRTGSELLVGSGEEGPLTNTLWHLSSQGSARRYDKRVLVPSGEFFPFFEVLGPIYARFGVTPESNHTPGRQAGVFSLPGEVRVGGLICYESVLPWVARDCVRQGAQVLVLPTSDASFGLSAGPRQHLAIARLRAIETGRPIIRAAATGISALIGPSGQLDATQGLGQTGALAGTVALPTRLTPFVRAGDWFVGLCAAIALAAALGALGGRRRVGEGEEAPAHQP